ncbi:MAG: hypothetical protein WA927_03290, partial [Rhodococcus sp. (in: high G+C Gram-positive bacteria)]
MPTPATNVTPPAYLPARPPTSPPTRLPHEWTIHAAGPLQWSIHAAGAGERANWRTSEQQPLLARLRQVALLDFRVDAEVVQRPGHH